MSATRGEVWEYVEPTSGRFRVVVVSSDIHNETLHAWPLCALVSRRPLPGGEIPAFTVALADPDPLGGVVVTSTVRSLDPAGRETRLGMVTGATMNRINAAIRALFDLE